MSSTKNTHAGHEYPRPPSRYSWYVVGVVTLAYIVSFVDRQIITLLVEPIKQDLNLNDTQIGLLQGLSFALLYSFLGIPIGVLADRISRTRIITVGIVLWSLFTAACGLTRSFATLFAARVGVGVGEAALTPSVHSMLADIFPANELGKAISVYTLSMYLGSGVALIAGGAVVEFLTSYGQIHLPVIGLLQPWQSTFFLVGAPGFLVALLMKTVREPRRQISHSSEAAGPSFGATIAYLRKHFRLFGSLILGSSLQTMVAYGVIAWAPTVFIRLHGMNAANVGLIYGCLIAAAGAAGMLTGGWLSSWLQRSGKTAVTVRLAIAGLLIFWPVASIFPIVGNQTLCFLVLAIALFAQSFATGHLFTIFPLISPPEMRAQVSALHLFIANLIGFGLGPFLVGFLTDYYFEDPMALGRSLALVGVVVTPASIGCLIWSIAPYREYEKQAADRAGA
ncbi:spinster family MFS transporter [Hyphococcus luteus]|nr:MFS transporter [Marinicaulis flavus]